MQREKSSSEHTQLQNKIAFSSIGPKEGSIEPKEINGFEVRYTDREARPAVQHVEQQEVPQPRADSYLYPPLDPNIPLADQLQISDDGSDGYQTDENTSEY